MELACSSSSSGLPSSSCADSSSSSCASSISGSKKSKNGISTSLRRLSVPHSLSEAKAVTKSALKAGKYRVKETSRDLWTRTKKETKGAKRKSKELVSLSTDLLSSLSLRVQEKINGSPRHGGIVFKKGGRESSSDANLDGSCCDEEEYCWDSDFSDTSYDSTDCDHPDIVSFDQRRLHPKNAYNHENIYENDEEEGEGEEEDGDEDDDMPCVEGEVAGADTAIESRGRRRMKVTQVECMSMRKINDDFVADNVLVGKSQTTKNEISTTTTKEGMRQDLEPNQHLPHIEEQRKILMHGLSLHLKERNLHQNSKDDQSKDQGLISLQQQHQQPPSHLSSQTPSFSTTGPAYTITTTGGKGRLGEVDHVKRKEEIEKDQDKRLPTSTTTTSRTVKSSSLLPSTSSTTDVGRRDVSLPEDQLELNGSTDNDRLVLRPPRPPPPSSFPSSLLSTSFLSTNSPPSSSSPLSPDHRYQHEGKKTSSSLQEENEKQQQQHESIDSKMNEIAMMKKVVPPKPKLPLPPKPTLPFLHLKCSPVHQHHLSSSPYQSSNTSSPDSNQQTHLHNDYHQDHQPTVAKITTLNNVRSQEGNEEDWKDRMECRESKIGQGKAGPSPSKTADNSVQEKFRNNNHNQQMMKHATSLGLRASSSSSLTSSTTPQASSANNNNSRPSSVTGVTGCKRASRIERPKEQPPPPPIPPPLPKTSPPPLTDDLQEELVVSFVSSDLPSSSSSPTNTAGISSTTTTLVSSPGRKASSPSSSFSNSVSASFTTSRLHNSINGGHKTTDGIKNISTATTAPNGIIKDVKEGNDAGGVRKESPSSLRTGIPSSCKTTPRTKSPPSSSALLQDEVRKSPEKKDKHPESPSRKVNCDVERIISQQHAHDNSESIPTSPEGKSRETLINDKDIKRYDTVEHCRRQQQYRQEELDDSRENNGIPEKEAGSTRGEENEEEASSSSSSSFEEMMSAKSSLSSRSLHVDDEEDDEDEGKNATGENNRQDVLFDEDLLSEGSYEVPDESCPWFRSDLTRAAAEKYLSAPDRTEGFFVIRPGSSPIFPFSLSLLSEGRVYHLNIRKHDGVSKTSFSLGKSPSGRVFDSLKDLVSHYTNKPLLLVSTKHLNNNNITPNSNNHANPSSSSISIHPPKKYVCLVLQVNNLLHPPPSP